MNFRILIAEDEDITRKHLLYALKKEGYEVVGARNGREALEYMEREHFDALITDVKMPEMSGIELLENVKENYAGVEVMIITGFGSIDSAVEAMKKGAYEYITKPFNLDELLLKVKNIHERKVLKKENIALKAFFEMNKQTSIIARSESMKSIMTTVENMRDSDCHVLITGETGVGKSLLAKIIHFTSRRHTMPFLSINCATLTEELIAKELLGYEQVAVSGALEAKPGLMEIGDSGTLFIDAITELSPSLQKKLLKVIEDGELIRIGGTKPVRVDVRLIAASSVNIKGMVSESGFDKDLYYRLNVMEIFVPPLREHKEDIEPLGRFFLQKYLPDLNKKIDGFSAETIKILMNYSFPGNIRELENIVEGAAIRETTNLITPESLPRSLKLYRIDTFHPERIKTVAELTKEYAQKVLDLAEGDKVRAAELLGVSEFTLWKMLSEE